MSKTITDVKTTGLARFYHCVHVAQFTLGIYYDTPEFRAELNELLACEAAVWWYRAVDAAPMLLVKPPALGLIARACGGVTADRKVAEAMVRKAADDLHFWATTHHSQHLDDFGHLRRQAIESSAAPMLGVAMMLFGMSQTQPAQSMQDVAA